MGLATILVGVGVGVVAIAAVVLWQLMPNWSLSYNKKVNATVATCQAGVATPGAPTAAADALKIKFTVPAATATINGYAFEYIKKDDATVRGVVKAEITSTVTTLPATVSTADLAVGVYICRQATRYVQCGYGQYGAAVEVTIA